MCYFVFFVNSVAVYIVKVEVKSSSYRPEQTHWESGRLRLPDFYDFRHNEGHPYAPAVFTPRSIVVLIFRG